MSATSKTTKNKPVMDISRPAKTAATPEKLVIESRPLIEHDETVAPDAGSDIENKADKTPVAETAKTGEPEPNQTPAPSAAKKVLTPPTLSTTEATDTPDATEPTKDTETEDVAPDEGALSEADGSPATEATKTQRDKDAEETKKAVEQARRDQEVKEYIENKQFFVPINEIARKRSIKVSFGLVLLMALLAVVLIDLMLDSGVILLLQKIPHTSFFST